MIKNILIIALGAIVTTRESQAQSVAINNDASLPNVASILDVKSTNKGILIPRIALTGTNDVITVPNRIESLFIYNTSTTTGANAVSPGFYFWNGTAWIRLTTNTSSLFSGWLLGGNSGTSSTSHFIGTTDDNSLEFRVNNERAGHIGKADDGNVFIGHQSGKPNSSYRNVAIGINALSNNYVSAIVAIGDSALYSNTSGYQNTAIGSRSLFANTDGHDNTALGFEALKQASGPGVGFNTAVGSNAMRNSVNGSINAAFGVFALFYNTTGAFNTAIGGFSLQNNTTGGSNAALGALSLVSNTTGNSNTAMGANSLYGSTTAHSNVGIGVSALYNNTTSSNLVAVGDSSLFNSTSGYANTAIGSKALFANTTGVSNTAVGGQALFRNVDGGNNVAIGYGALGTNISGIANCALGRDALFSNLGDFNTGIGVNALGGVGNGENNTALGFNADVAPNSLLTNATAIGSNAMVGCSNCLVLGSEGSVNVGIGNPYPGFPLNFYPVIGDKISLYGNSGNHYGFGIQSGLLQIHADLSTSDVAIGYGSSSSFTQNFKVKGNGDVLLGISNVNATLTFGQSLSKKIIFFHGGTGGDAAMGVFPSELRLQSDYSGAAITFGYDNLGTSFRENMRIEGNGNLQVRGSIFAISSFYTSDIRLKTNVQVISSGLDKIIQLNAYHFNWKDVELDQAIQTGLIAQEVQKLFPELIHQDNKGYLGVNYVGFIPYLIQSIKQQQQQITEQDEKLARLQKENEEFKKMKTEWEQMKKQMEDLLSKKNN